MAATLHEMVREAARLHSGRTAVMFDSGSDSDSGGSSVTYEELLSSGNELTACLRKHGVVNSHILGLFCQPNINLPQWILGILQLPSAYLPLNPEASPAQTLRIVNLCNLSFCLVQCDLLQQFQANYSSSLTLEISAEWPEQNLALVRMQSMISSTTEKALLKTGCEQVQTGHKNESHSSASETTSQMRLAYVLHTSGTTGLPKIVKVPHQCIVPNIQHLRFLFQITPSDTVFLASPLTFDPSVVEMFLALSAGAQLLIVHTVIKRMPSRLARVLFNFHRTTVLQATPTLLRRFGRHVLQEVVLSPDSSLRVLALGGEVCPSPAILRSWRQEGNHTLIFNLYGTTEVSCWATYHRIPESVLTSDHTTTDSVPLGAPLDGTEVEVRDKKGCLVTEGEGQLFIGGRERVCLLDGEVTVTPGMMRASGDWVLVKDGQLYYLGRKDRLVKRHGQQVHLDTVQQVVESLAEVETCAVDLCEGSRLVAFIVPYLGTTASRNIHHRDQASEHADLRGDSVLLPMNRKIQRRLSHVLSSNCIPDTVLLVPSLPLTTHGKVAMNELKMEYERQRQNTGIQQENLTLDNLQEILAKLWKETLGLAEDVRIQPDSHFLLSGGDSLQALRFHQNINIATGTNSAGLLEVILDGSYSDIWNHITMATIFTEAGLDPQVPSKRKHEGSSSSVLPKKQIHAPPSTTAPETLVEGVLHFNSMLMGYVVRRAGEIIKLGYSDNTVCSDNLKAEQATRSKSFQVEGHKTTEDFNSNPSSTVSERTISKTRSTFTIKRGLSLRVLWSSDTGRCVDASPVLLVEHGSSHTATVFVGSHSHRMQALELTSGAVRWERVLGDRLESSAAISVCGKLVVVGCYDGQVYFLRVDSGETWWTFKTGDAVKSCPTVDYVTGLIIIGSHDGHIYALDSLAKKCMWKQNGLGGAIFSSPCLHPPLQLLYAATLHGRLLCLNSVSGVPIWTYSRDVPFFSSPQCSNSCVFIGSVDGSINGFNHKGAMLWQFATSGPVFSSPCVTSSNPRVVCGSHDGCVYCLNCTDGSLVWKFQTTGKVFSTPFVFESPRGQGTLVALASTDGTVWVLNAEDGTVCASASLSGELFSSPVVWEHMLVIGCRNDYVYCLDLNSKEDSFRL
uniref:Carrier domain-containing protein n=1 Tax=Denticeps clupeoides TaxID=299321 RepID=A0AAY4D451_9TELE